MTQPNAVVSTAGRKEWIGLAVIALPCLLYSMDLTVLHLAVPKLSEDLRPSSAQLLWIIDIYGFLVAGSLITAGTLGDRIGRRRLLLIGAAMFGVASILAAFSRSAGMLIATRALLGIAGATVAPSTLSLIRNMFPDDRERTTAISIWIVQLLARRSDRTSDRRSTAGALLVGVGVLAECSDHGTAADRRTDSAARVPRSERGQTRLAERRNVAGRGAEHDLRAEGHRAGWGEYDRGCFHHAWESRSASHSPAGKRDLADPLIDLKLFRIPSFRASLVIYGGSILVMFGGFFFLPQYLQLVLGLSPFTGGLWTLPWAAAFVLGSLVTPALARRFRREVAARRWTGAVVRGLCPADADFAPTQTWRCSRQRRSSSHSARRRCSR